MKIVTVIGARPQFIKAAMVSHEISRYNEARSGKDLREIIIHTGQHYDYNMSDVFLKELQLPDVDYNLEIRANTHGAMTGRMLEKIEGILLKESPDAVLTYGDTNSTLAGALAAAKLNIPVAHVEAGLRSFNTKMPEEINRILTDRLSSWLFCPSEIAIENLKKEGLMQRKSDVFSKRIPIMLNVGDVMYDAVLYYNEIVKPSDVVKKLLQQTGDRFYLATIHRAENTDEPYRLREIIDALDEISVSTPIILPLHPRTKKSIFENKINVNNLRIINPVSYFDMLVLLKACKAVFTDSGGLQKEAYFHRKICMTLRDETEWSELVSNGFNFIVSYKKENIMNIERSLEKKTPNWDIQLYGDGRASERIVKMLSS